MSRRLLDIGFKWQTREKIELGRQASRHWQIEMTEGDPGQHAATRCTLHKPFLDQIGLDDLFDHIALVAQHRCYRFDPNRAAPVVFGDAAQVAPIHTVKAAPIDLQPQQRRVGGGRIYARQTLDRGKVADPPQQAHRDARGAGSEVAEERVHHLRRDEA